MSATLKSPVVRVVMRERTFSSSRIMGHVEAGRTAHGHAPADRPGAAPLGLRHHPRRNVVHGTNRTG